MNPLKKFGNSPIRKNILANLFGVGVNLLNQIALVPLYIYFWGNDLYADWLVLSAITVIFSMSDIGLNTVIQNRFSIKLAEKDTKECNELLTDNIVIVSAIFAVSLLIVASMIAAFDLVKFFNLHSITNTEAAWVLILIVVKIYVGMYSGIENAIYRANHKNSRCVYIDQLSLLSTVLITAACLYFSQGLVTLCIALCLPPIVVIIFKWFDSKKYFDYHFSFRNINKPLLISLVKPSLAFMAFPIGNAILLQGYTFIVNKYFGAADVVEYNTTRTMCNFIIVLLSTINNSVWPEYSIAYGQNDYRRMRGLHSKSLTTSWLFSIICAIAILLLGPYIYKIWTGGLVQFSYPLMTMFIMAVLMKITWTASGITLMATNNHQRMGLIYAVSCGASIIIAIWLCISKHPLYLVTATMILAHFAMTCYTIKAGLKLTHDNIKDLNARNIEFLLRKHQK